jgi:ribonuclease D
VNVKKHPDVTVNLVRTLTEGINIFRTNREKSLVVMKKYLRGASDDILAEIARRGPTKTEELSAYRGVPRNEVERILEAVRRAKALPPDQHPEPEARDNDPPHVVMLGSLLGVVLADWCTRNKLAANLVASGSDLKAIVRSRVFREPPPEVPLTRGWRAAAVLTELQAILDGKKAVRVVNPSAAAPLGFLPIEPTKAESAASPTAAEDTL